MEIVLNPFIGTIFNLFLISALVITMYTLNFYYLVLLSSRRIANMDVVAFKADSVTIHLPIYNEKYVAARLIDAVCKMDYPKEKMRIMVLDDSDDDTVGLIADLVAKYRKLGFYIEAHPASHAVRLQGWSAKICHEHYKHGLCGHI